MGGRYPGRFPTPMRVAAFLQAIVLSGFALIALTKAKVIGFQYQEFAADAIWFVVGVSGLSLFMNLITPVKWERILWAPMAAVMFVTSGMLAMQGGL